jgi:F-type H+-transporting ATPase subunit delta
MKLTSQQYAQALYDAVHETNPKDHDLVMDRFVKILAQNGDLNKHSEIETEYKKLEHQSHGIKEAEVTVAKEAELNKGIVDELNKIAGTKLDIKKKVDEGIVGGIIMKVDDTLLDASIKTQLDKLNQELKS